MNVNVNVDVNVTENVNVNESSPVRVMALMQAPFPETRLMAPAITAILEIATEGRMESRRSAYAQHRDEEEVDEPPAKHRRMSPPVPSEYGRYEPRRSRYDHGVHEEQAPEQGPEPSGWGQAGVFPFTGGWDVVAGQQGQHARPRQQRYDRFDRQDPYARHEQQSQHEYRSQSSRSPINEPAAHSAEPHMASHLPASDEAHDLVLRLRNLSDTLFPTSATASDEHARQFTPRDPRGKGIPDARDPSVPAYRQYGKGKPQYRYPHTQEYRGKSGKSSGKGRSGKESELTVPVTLTVKLHMDDPQKKE